MLCLVNVLALDIDNAFSVVAEGLLAAFKEQEDFEGFKLACIVNFGLIQKLQKKNLKKKMLNSLSDSYIKKPVKITSSIKKN